MNLNRRQPAGPADAGSEICKKPARADRHRNLGTLVRRVQGLEFVGCGTSGRDGGEEAGSRGITTASINRLHSIAMTRHSRSIQSEPPSPFVLFLL